MNKRLRKFKSKYGSAIQVIKKHKHTEEDIDQALRSLNIPKGITLQQIKNFAH
jgi:hypothetical protein